MEEKAVKRGHSGNVVAKSQQQKNQSFKMQVF